MKFNDQDVALKLIAALYTQGKVNNLTYSRIVQKYGSVQGGVRIGLRKSA